MDEQNQIPINERLQIPWSELQFRFSTSSGPGGQHANRSATRVTLLFDVAGSPSLPEEARAQLRRKLAARLDKEGVLRIDVQDTRSQSQNREIAVSRFQALLAEALKRPKKRRKTRPGAGVRESRLAEKKKRGTLKRDRARDWRDD